MMVQHNLFIYVEFTVFFIHVNTWRPTETFINPPHKGQVESSNLAWDANEK